MLSRHALEDASCLGSRQHRHAVPRSDSSTFVNVPLPQDALERALGREQPVGDFSLWVTKRWVGTGT